ncbi:hypothetical protein C6P40_004823 [Pichia californica]|uniref:Ankyrin repeat-containing protein YAR1 n=1 Tax=Pichia californica TaxID=460514 RepID=A0A9P7BHL4_9ASCO|nr:hypothetical protein C6P42_003432 [[Candida] californica]KAG0689568.1 hypothetical protein C6P40_004823 [[Candida] californica]
MTKLTQLSQEEMDNVIYDARFGDIESLTEIFTKEVEADVLKTIKDEESLTTPFHMASANGHIEVLKFLINLIKDKEELKNILNFENDCGNTALHWASYNGHLEIVKLLCENGADPFIRNKYNHDSFFEASNNDQESVDDYLLERYGNIVEQDIDDGEEEVEESGKAVEGESVKFSEGTEIAKVTEEDKKAVDQLTEKTEGLAVE